MSPSTKKHAPAPAPATTSEYRDEYLVNNFPSIITHANVNFQAPTYENADKVLAINDWIVKTGFSNNPSLNLLKLKSCTYDQPLWTLR